MKRLLITGIVCAGAMFAQLDASNHLMPTRPGAGPDYVRMMSLRSMEFNSAWFKFANRLFNCAGAGCAGMGRLSMQDYVKSCEAAKRMFPALHGECRDTKQLQSLFGK